MKRTLCYIAWALLDILCIWLGTVPAETAAGKVLLIAVSLIFFLPACLLLADAIRTSDRRTLLCLRTVSIVSLSATLLLLILSFCCYNASAAVGKVVHALLLIFSSPMFCSQYWILSLFLWACLLFATVFGKSHRAVNKQ